MRLKAAIRKTGLLLIGVSCGFASSVEVGTAGFSSNKPFCAD